MATLEWATSAVSDECGIPQSAPKSRTDEARQFVRLMADALSALSDKELQAYICQCAEQFLAAHRRYEQSGCFADAGERDYFWLAEADALVERGCRPEVVARMERERGLA